MPDDYHMNQSAIFFKQQFMHSIGSIQGKPGPE